MPAGHCVRLRFPQFCATLLLTSLTALHCNRLKVEGMANDIIAQSINTGSDVSGNQFDMQVGDGGAGIFNVCAGGKAPGKDTMFPGPYSPD
eukprot:gene10128-biopygen5197